MILKYHLVWSHVIHVLEGYFTVEPQSPIVTLPALPARYGGSKFKLTEKVHGLLRTMVPI